MNAYKICLIIISLLFAGGSLANDSFKESGQVAMVVGKVERISKRGGDKEKLERNSFVYPGDKIHTGPDGFIKILMKDETLLNLGASSQFEIVSFEFKTKKDRTSIYKLAQGQLRSLFTIKAKKEGDLKIETPTVAMGIRGTEILTNVYPVNGQMHSDVALLSGKLELTSFLPSMAGQKHDLKTGEVFNSFAADRAKDIHQTQKLSDASLKQLQGRSTAFLPSVVNTKGQLVNVDSAVKIIFGISEDKSDARVPAESNTEEIQKTEPEKVDDGPTDPQALAVPQKDATQASAVISDSEPDNNTAPSISGTAPETFSGSIVRNDSDVGPRSNFPQSNSESNINIDQPISETAIETSRDQPVVPSNFTNITGTTPAFVDFDQSLDPLRVFNAQDAGVVLHEAPSHNQENNSFQPATQIQEFTSNFSDSIVPENSPSLGTEAVGPQSDQLAPDIQLDISSSVGSTIIDNAVTTTNPRDLQMKLGPNPASFNGDENSKGKSNGNSFGQNNLPFNIETIKNFKDPGLGQATQFELQKGNNQEGKVKFDSSNISPPTE